MAIIDIWSIINPIKNELQNKAWQIVNDVTSKVNQIKDDIKNGIQFFITTAELRIKSTINSIEDGIKRAIDWARNRIENTISRITDTVSGLIRSATNSIDSMRTAIYNKLIEIKSSIETKIISVKRDIEIAVGRAISSGVNIIKGYVDIIEIKVNTVINSLSGIARNIVDDIKSRVNDAIPQIINTINNSLTTVKDFISGIINTARNIITDKIDHIKVRLEGIWDNIKITIQDLKNWIKGNIDYIQDTIIGRVNNIKNDITNKINEQINIIQGKFSQVKDDLTDFIDRQIKALRDRIDKIVDDIKKGLEDFLIELGKKSEHIASIIGAELDSRVNEFSGIIEKLTTNQYDSYEEFQKDFKTFGGNAGLLSSLLDIVVAGSLYLNSVVSIGQPFAQNIENLALAKARPSIIPPSVLVKAHIKNYMGLDDYHEQMALNGYTTNRADTMLQTEKEITSPGEAQIAFLRGLISESEHDDILVKWGFELDKIALLKQLYMIIPPVSDIITMAVREVFSPDTAERFGQFEDFPEEFASFAEQQGLSKEWAKNYWAAHWSLPSPTQGFEMLHRRVIDRNDLVMLLKALDIMPFWREKLIQISYNPLTRVDIRRMHKLGVLNEQEVYDSYLDIGYNEINARRNTEFTVKLNAVQPDNASQEIRALTRSIIEQAYRQGIIQREEAGTRLVNIGYTVSDADFLLKIQDSLNQIESSPEIKSSVVKRTIQLVLDGYATRTFGLQEATDQLMQLGMTQLEASTELGLIDYAVNTKLKQRYVDSIQDLYTNWVIDASQVFIYLNDLGFNQGEIEAILTELDIIRNTRTKLPTKEDLKRWVKSGIITLEEYINDMKGQGFPDIYIDRYVMEVTGVE